MSTPSPAALRDAREVIVRTHVAAENAGDVDATIATFHTPRYNVIPMGAIADGDSAVRHLISGLVEAFPDFHFHVDRLHHADTAIIVEGTMTGTQRAEWAGIAARGATMTVAAACIFDFDGDRLLNETVYFDFATLQRQLAG
jgi:steroid delta-isomerase-like uncharacterized protein